MPQVTFEGSPVRVAGRLPATGSQAPAFSLVDADLRDRTLEDFAGRRKILNVFPSIDTPTCAASVRKFNAYANGLTDTAVLCVSADLPFAQSRFCGAEGLDNVVTLSLMRGSRFSADYGVQIADGDMVGLTARALFVLDTDNRVLHAELVGDISDEPDYDAALAVLK